MGRYQDRLVLIQARPSEGYANSMMRSMFVRSAFGRISAWQIANNSGRSALPRSAAAHSAEQHNCDERDVREGTLRVPPVQVATLRPDKGDATALRESEERLANSAKPRRTCCGFAMPRPSNGNTCLGLRDDLCPFARRGAVGQQFPQLPEDRQHPSAMIQRTRDGERASSEYRMRRLATAKSAGCAIPIFHPRRAGSDGPHRGHWSELYRGKGAGRPHGGPGRRIAASHQESYRRGARHGRPHRRDQSRRRRFPGAFRPPAGGAGARVPPGGRRKGAPRRSAWHRPVVEHGAEACHGAA